MKITYHTLNFFFIMYKLISLVFFFGFHLCFGENIFKECSCYNDWNNEEPAYKIKLLIEDYESSKKNKCLDDGLAPYTFNTKYHVEINRLNGLTNCNSYRYRSVYKNILIFEKKLNVIQEFWYNYYEYLIKKLKPWDPPYTQAERDKSLANDRAYLAKRVNHCKTKLDENTVKILNIYIKLFEDCLKKHTSIATYHDYGLFAYLNNDFDKASILLSKTLELAEAKNQLAELNAENYFDLGAFYFESMAYEKSIEFLSEAISRDPGNKAAYFERASAYFETGAFDLAIQDYLSSESKPHWSQPHVRISTPFSNALISGLISGSSESAIEFVPSLCRSMYGLGETLWITANHPVESANQFITACHALNEGLVDYCKNLNWDTVDEYVDQIKILTERYNQLTESEKGELMGYAIGKYGVDIFAGGSIFKGVSAYQNLRNANRLCNLEAMTISQANKEAVIFSALNHSSARESFFKKVTIHRDRQNKHIIGMHNYEPNQCRSIVTHNDPERLIKNFAGKGIPKNNVTPGLAGYVERVDFGEIIGCYINEKQPLIKIPTTKGTIKYGKNGAHIVPSDPKG